MTQMLESTPANPAPAEVDLPTAALRVLSASTEPLTPSKVRAALPAPHRQVALEELTEQLRRQAAANVLYQYPKYRSQHDRFWDRPMPIHVAALIHETLAEGPLPLSELRRKLPAYAQTQAETVLNEQLTQGKVYRHPRLPGSRGGDLFGARPPDAKDYLRRELPGTFRRLLGLGFTASQLRSAALELLHDEEWASTSMTEEVEPRPARPKAESGAPMNPSYEWREPEAPATPTPATETNPPQPG
jgi:hypothetical protein